ncbi:kinesin-like protein KIN-14E isoform X3 [Xenia sp. Carnegie-2017]|uniref:kinesin-like protein KIN-14E isoform X3 n=1 Tax=Xenia sp. Carnegie-2017 TaxID=2897299 RepID=UPI001F04F61D|nr:kinesin-like protein KIN-14E isoform X3 [Xenia sp. Carnegie-2017]
MMASTHTDESEEEVCEVDKSLTELSRVFILLLQKHGEERAAYKLRKKQKRESRSPTKLEMQSSIVMTNGITSCPEMNIFSTNFMKAIKIQPPPAPPALIKGLSKRKSTGGKVKVLLRISPSFPGETSSFLKVDQKKKQVTLYCPTAINHVSQKHRRMGIAAPKMFAFDSIFEPDSSQAELCGTALVDVLQSVVNGSDGCIFAYGHSGLGKTFSMIGGDESVHSLGIIPCSIEWLFKLIEEKREKTGARFSIRVSAVEVVGRSENLNDLLQEHSNGCSDSLNGTKPSVYLYDDPVSGPQLLNHSELRASSAEKAAFYLDAALATRTVPNNEKDSEETLNSHMFFTIHVYQSRVDKIAGKMGVHGGRSRLHLIDLASCERYNAVNKETSCSSMSLSGLGNVIIALINGVKHVPHKDSTLTRLLRESLGSTTCRATMVAHISPSIPFYTESLSCVQFAARIHRLRRKKAGQGSGTSSSGGESSCDEMRMRKPRIRTSALADPLQQNNNGHSDYNSSTGEESCDTVIYCGPDGELSDRDLTDNEGPSHMSNDCMKSTPVKVDQSLKSKLDAIEEKPADMSERCPSMELEYDLSEEFKGNIERVPEKGSVENLTLKKKKKITETCEFWEDPLEKINHEDKENIVEDLPQTSDQNTTIIRDSVDVMELHHSEKSLETNGFVPIIEEEPEKMLSDEEDDELSHSPALDTPLETFYHLVPDSDSDAQEKIANSKPKVGKSQDLKISRVSPSSPNSTEIQSILENYVVNQMLIKNSDNERDQRSLYNVSNHDEENEKLEPPLTPQKTCVAETAQISATSPKKVKLERRPRNRTLLLSNRNCLSDVGENCSDTHSEDSYESTKTDPLHYVKTPRRGLKSFYASSGSLPREYKVVIRDKMAYVHYVGCEMDRKIDIEGQHGTNIPRSLNKAPVTLKYCGSQQRKYNEQKENIDTPESQRKTVSLTITSRAAFAFGQSSPLKPKIKDKQFKYSEPFVPHCVELKHEKEDVTVQKKDVSSSQNMTRKDSKMLDVFRQRSKLKAARRRESVHGYSSGLASDGSLTDSPLSKSPARRRRRLGSELSSSGYESMRDCTTSHVSGSDSADEKLMIPDSSNTDESRCIETVFSGSNRIEFERLYDIDERRENNNKRENDSILDIHKWNIIRLRSKQVELKMSCVKQRTACFLMKPDGAFILNLKT